MFEVVSVLLAAVLLISIAFPQLFLLLEKDRKKVVGSSYWGVYHDAAPKDPQAEEHKIVAPKPGRKWHVVAGSAMYAGRR